MKCIHMHVIYCILKHHSVLTSHEIWPYPLIQPNYHCLVVTELNWIHCFICSLFFQCHINSHTGVRPFHCSTCQKSFRYSSTLKNHIRLHSEKPYKCHLCNEVFLRHDTLVRHEFRHTGAKPFECDICKATFSFKDYLKCHMRKHLGNKAVSCPTCGRECCDYNSLRRHLATHTGMCSKYV